MTDIDVVADGPGRFGVTVREGHGRTNHEVTVPEGFLAGVGLAGADAEQAVRASFAFLLEREPATSIMGRFDLPTITRFFPDYPQELRRRLAPG